jgi:hypothetical protein
MSLLLGYLGNKLCESGYEVTGCHGTKRLCVVVRS